MAGTSRATPARRRLRRRVRFAVDLIVTAASLTAAVMIILALQRSGRPPSPEMPLPTEPLSIEGAATLGDPSARTVIVQYSEFECPYCGKFARETLPALKERYIRDGSAQLVFRHFPLPNHARAVPAAASAICAERQSKFWEMHDLLFDDQKNLDDSSLWARARRLGLNESRFVQCLSDPAVAEIAKRDARDAQALRISGTPTLAIGTRQQDGRVKVERMLKGAVPFSEIEGAIDRVHAQVPSTGASAWTSPGMLGAGVGLLGLVAVAAVVRHRRQARRPLSHGMAVRAD